MTAKQRDWIFVGTYSYEAAKATIVDVARQAGVTPSLITGHSRSAPLVKIRHAAIYLAWRRTGHSLPVLGKAFNRDHTSILYALNAVRSAPHRYPLIEVNDPGEETWGSNCGEINNSHTDHSASDVEYDGVLA